jgi:G3E family GTPase
MKDSARILRTTKAEVPLPLVLSVGLFESDQYFKTEEVKDEHHDHDHAQEHDHECAPDCGHDHHHHDHHHHHHDHSHHLENDGFTSISFESDKPFSIRKFQHFLDNQLPSNVFRAKGILWFKESPKRHIFHLSGKRFSLEDSEWKAEPKNQLVLIGQNLDHAGLREQIESCLNAPVATRGKGFGR